MGIPIFRDEAKVWGTPTLYLTKFENDKKAVKSLQAAHS